MGKRSERNRQVAETSLVPPDLRIGRSRELIFVLGVLHPDLNSVGCNHSEQEAGEPDQEESSHEVGRIHSEAGFAVISLVICNERTDHRPGEALSEI